MPLLYINVVQGKLLVAGGEGVGRGGKEYLDDMEVFTGRRWSPYIIIYLD